MAEGRLERWLRPGYVFALLTALLVLAVLSTPEAPSGDTESHLTTYGTETWGARGVYDVLKALGVRVDRRLTPWKAPLDSAAVYVVLEPLTDPSARETAALLDAVRRGAGLIVVAENGPPLSDSLLVRRSPYQGGRMRAVTDSLFGRAWSDSSGLDPVHLAADSSGTERDTSRGVGARVLALSTEQGAHVFRRYLRGAPRSDSDTTRVLPSDTVTLLAARGRLGVRPVIMGRRLGLGRVLLIADPTFLSNAPMRRGDAAVLTLRLLEWVDPGRANPVVFDEYHQGYGHHAKLVRTVVDALVSHPAGRVVLQVVFGALLLLLAASVRPIAPRSRTIIERRSPLEHVGALSRAYARVGATRLAVRRLVRGLRRRHPLGATGALDDAGYLGLLKERAAGVAKDADLLLGAMREALPVGEFVRAGAAIDHIERTLTS